jgi:hypothetical protein
MIAVLLALGLVGGMVGFAIKETLDPAVKPAFLKFKLARLAKKPVTNLKLDEAEDGVVLARRLGRKDLEKKFAGVVTILKKKRPAI